MSSRTTSSNYETRSNDFTVRLGATKEIEFHDDHRESEWRVTIVDTGLETMTGGRVKRVQPYVGTSDAWSPTGTGSPMSTSPRCSRSTSATAGSPP